MWVQKSNKPHYHVLFSASYGLNRRQLADLCHSIRSSRRVPFDLGATSTFAKGQSRRPSSSGHVIHVFDSPVSQAARKQRLASADPYCPCRTQCASFTFSLAPQLLANATRPSIIFSQPRVFEMTGAGFQKAPGSRVRSHMVLLDAVSSWHFIRLSTVLRTSLSPYNKSGQI